MPAPVVIDGYEEWEVERILRQHGRGNRTHYLVKYAGYDESEAYWLARDDLANCPEVLAAWEADNA